MTINFSHLLGEQLEGVSYFSLYTILQVTVSKDDTIILDGAGDKAIIEERLDQVRALCLTNNLQLK